MYILLGYFFAICIKLSNMYYITILEMHIMARRQNCLIEDVLKQKYFQFYFTSLAKSEQRQLVLSGSNRHTAIMAIYFFILLRILFFVLTSQDPELANMIIICLLELFLEVYPFVPSWKRRQILLLDFFIRQQFCSLELWHEDLFLFSFSKHMQLNPTKEAQVYEIHLIKSLYGKLGSQMLIQQLEENGGEWDGLAKIELAADRDFSKLKYIYPVQLSFISIWLFTNKTIIEVLFYDTPKFVMNIPMHISSWYAHLVEKVNLCISLAEKVRMLMANKGEAMDSGTWETALLMGAVLLTLMLVTYYLLRKKAAAKVPSERVDASQE